MKQVGVRELKNRLSAYIRYAKNGETITITERGKAVAILKREPSNPLELRLEAMHAKGLIRISEGGTPQGLGLRRQRVQGAPLSKAVIEARR